MARKMLAMWAATLLFGGLTLTGASAQSPTQTPTDEKITFIYGDTSEPSSLNPFRGYLGTDFYFWGGATTCRSTSPWTTSGRCRTWSPTSR
jgi:ABC-type transport system substrate-binding protein